MRAAAIARAALLLGMVGFRPATAAEAAYPFVGSWVRSDRACTASAARERTYTPKEVVSSRSRCAIRRVAHGTGGYELFERCERPGEKPANISEIIRMTGPDTMVLTRQTARLKLSRSLRYTRCAVAVQSPTGSKPH